MLPDYYQILEVPKGATTEAIKASYRRLVRLYHPDVNPSTQARARFEAIQLAYETLSDPANRYNYDLQRQAKTRTKVRRNIKRQLDMTPQERRKLMLFMAGMLLVVVLAGGVVWWMTQVFVRPEPILNLSHRRLSELPEGLTHSTTIRSINLSHNALTELPLHLPNLRVLNIAQNQLLTLPDSLPGLEQLQELDLSWNHIEYLPPALAALPALKRLILTGNPLTPADIRQFKHRAPKVDVVY